jgi:hypothetical protein
MKDRKVRDHLRKSTVDEMIILKRILNIYGVRRLSWNHPPYDSDQMRASVKTVKILRVPQKTGKLLTS